MVISQTQFRKVRRNIPFNSTVYLASDRLQDYYAEHRSCRTARSGSGVSGEELDPNPDGLAAGLARDVGVVSGAKRPVRDAQTIN